MLIDISEKSDFTTTHTEFCEKKMLLPKSESLNGKLTNHPEEAPINFTSW